MGVSIECISQKKKKNMLFLSQGTYKKVSKTRFKLKKEKKLKAKSKPRKRH